MRPDTPYRLRLLRDPSLTPLLAASLAACGGGGSSSSSSSSEPPRIAGGNNNGNGDPPPPNNISGRLYDGPVAGANVYIDVDENGQIDAEIDHFISRTDEMGQYAGHAPEAHKDKPLIADLNGATDKGKDLTSDHDDTPTSGFWRAPAGSKNISPMTELMLAADKTEAEVAKLLNLPANVKVTDYDPFEDDTLDATDEAVIEAGQKLAAELAKKPDDIEAAVAKAFAPEPPEPPEPPPEPVDEKPTALAIVTQTKTYTLNGVSVSVDLLQQNDSGDWVARYDEEKQLSATHLATLTLTDDALGDNQLTLSDTTYLELRATDNRLVWQLWLKERERFDYEAAAQHEAMLSLNTNAALAQRIVIKIGDRDDPPSEVILSETELTLEEGTQTARKLADISFTDPDTDPKHQDNQVRLSDDRLFELKNNNTELWLKAGAELDFETAQSHSVTLTAAPTITQIAKRLVNGNYPDDVTFAATTFTLTVTDDVSDNVPELVVPQFIVTDDTADNDSFAPITGQWLVKNIELGRTHRIEANLFGPSFFGGSKTWSDADGSYESTDSIEHDLFTLYYVESSRDPSHIGRYLIEFNNEAINALTEPTGHVPLRVKLFDRNQGSDPIDRALILVDFNGVDDSPTAFTLSATALELEAGTSAAQDLATITVTDVDGGPSGLTLTQNSGAFFVLDGTSLKLADGKTLTVGTYKATLSINGLPEQTFTLTVTPPPPPVEPPVEPEPQNSEAAIYENHPLNKPVYEAEGEGTFKLRGADKQHFTVDAEGKVWWREVADYENPKDKGKDNVYDIAVTHTASDGVTSKTQLSIAVNNIDIESSLPPDATVDTKKINPRPFFFIKPTDFTEAQKPSEYARHLLGNEVWKMPKTGPLLLTWSIDLAGSPALEEQADIERFRAHIRRVLDEFEAAANLKFVEVTHGTTIGDFYFTVYDDATGEGSSTKAAKGGIVLDNDFINDAETDGPTRALTTHEIGHMLGLTHPFHPENGWPGNSDYTYAAGSEDSIMSYYYVLGRGSRDTGLQAADIEALRFLYGAPNTDFAGVENIVTTKDPNHGQAHDPRPALPDLTSEQPNFYALHADRIDDTDKPKGLVAHLIDGRAWRAPYEGPAEISWTLEDVTSNPMIKTPEDEAAAKALIARALAEFEAAANVVFTDVTDQDNADDAYIKFRFIGANGLSRARFEGSEVTIRIFEPSVEDITFHTMVHEIGHAMGLKHPFDAKSGWPGDDAYRRGEDSHLSVMSYWNGWDRTAAENAALDKKFAGLSQDSGLQETDIEALQWLYGAPNTDWQGAEQHLKTTKSYRLSSQVAVPENIGIDDPILNLHEFLDNSNPNERDYYNFRIGGEDDEYDNRFFRVEGEFLYFRDSPDFENPQDTYGGVKYGYNNVYEFRVAADFPFADTELERNVGIAIEVTDII